MILLLLLIIIIIITVTLRKLRPCPNGDSLFGYQYVALCKVGATGTVSDIIYNF